VYFGKQREVEIGVLHGADTRFAEVMLDCAEQHSTHRIRRNEPYGPENGVAHTLDLHGAANGLSNVVLEIRNDRVADAPAHCAMADTLVPWLAASVGRLMTTQAS
jgi:predicted N-formylglutamate amidohydrolase